VTTTLTTTQSFDPVGRLDEVRFPVPTGSGAPAVSIRHTFDGFGALTNVAPSFGTNRTPYWTLAATNFYDQPSAEVFGDTATSGTSTDRGFDTRGRTRALKPSPFRRARRCSNSTIGTVCAATCHAGAIRAEGSQVRPKTSSTMA
jgi:hypothetical protein